MLKFSALTTGLPVIERGGNQDIDISGIHYDSRAIQPGYVFVAIKGFRTDGHLYLQAAAERGAAAAIIAGTVEVPPGLAWVRVADSRQALAEVAARFYDYPSRRCRLIGVTGTNGKTTTTHLVRAVLEEAGQICGLIGTVGNWVGGRQLPAKHTTPESLDLQFLLKEMVAAGVQSVVMEVSSHALALKRVHACEFDTAVFTNLTQDHLDFHRDLEEYFQTKALLFQSLGEGEKKGPKHAVLNADDPHTPALRQMCRVPVLTYSCEQEADVQATGIEIRPDGTRLKINTFQGKAYLDLQLTGLFNVYNALAACTAALAEGCGMEAVVAALSRVKGVPGRFERVNCGQPFSVIVDYAHTPDGLENVLRAAREITPGRIITVFGCGGDRDRSKRPLMGEAVARGSDYCFITSDNPRSEDPEAIIGEIEPGVRRVPGAAYEKIADRRQAIAAALSLARPGDTVLIAGKGHETYQIVKDKVLPFDDRQVAREELEKLGYVASDR
ncbi:MAG: UDP-N-acetylmuramoyl-L-alanyl-D-glutamate--2,6-diaminopimelate ligase [Clostridia bacterium]|nr:UDP-N-acetylmuramoyl-L-alanyl-D-glutamate--2,6-diaminopimelate ligase [Clostridia bacterium]